MPAAREQMNTRDPVTGLAGADVGGALQRLRDEVLVWRVKAARLGRWEGDLDGSRTLDAPVKAPTGDAGTLRGSGGWDAATGWFATWGRLRRQLTSGVGYDWLDPRGAWLGVRRDNTWHEVLEASAPVSRVLTLRASERLDSSPLRTFTDSNVGKTSFCWTVGVVAAMTDNTWTAFDIVEHLGGAAMVPDFSCQVQFGTRLGR